MATLTRPAPASSTSPRTIITGLVALLAGVVLGLAIALAAVGLLPFALGGTLVCSVNTNGTVSTCTNEIGQQVRVPHHIRIQQ